MADILLFLVSIMMLNTGNPVIREDPSPGFVNKSEKYIIIEAYDARMLDAEKKGTRFNTAVYEPHFYNRDEIVDLPVKIYGKLVEVRRKF